jgi:hypothetical protein
VPNFDAVFRRLNADLRESIYAELRTMENLTTEEALRIWQPLLKRAFGAAPRT